MIPSSPHATLYRSGSTRNWCAPCPPPPFPFPRRACRRLSDYMTEMQKEMDEVMTVFGMPTGDSPLASLRGPHDSALLGA